MSRSYTSSPPMCLHGIEWDSFIFFLIEQRVCDTLLKHKSLRKCRRKFHRKFPESIVPCKATIYRVVLKLCATESVLDKKKTRKNV
jgi:hypothetical protein